ncbi:MAG: protein kinase [Rhodospirillales bacterium]|nr:protein kinase [Rhodospirillales bacterium]
MPLEEDQKNWLLNAQRGKGRFASSGIKKQFENYKRRRQKVADVFDTLPRSHSNYLSIRAALTEADKTAEAGDFKAAYDSLNAAKALAKATDKGTSGRILENEISQSVKLLENTLSAHVDDVNAFYNKVDQALAGFTNLAPCRTKGSFEEGIQHLKTIVALEPNLRGTMAGLKDDAKALSKRFDPRQIKKQIADLREELQRLNDGGYGTIAGRYSGRVDAAENTYTSANDKYAYDYKARQHLEAATLQSEKVLLDRKNLEDFTKQQKRPDTSTKNVRSGLKQLDVWDTLDNLIRESDRMEVVRQQYLDEKAKDDQALKKVGSVDLELTPEPPQFHAIDVLGELDIDVDGTLEDSEVGQHVEDVGKKLTDLLKDDETPQSVLLDLMSKSLEDITNDVFNELFPAQKWNDISPEQQGLVSSMAKEMFDKINSEAPNKVSSDSDTVTLGDQIFNKVKVLKSGGLGTATLFEDPLTGKKLVMKTPNFGDKRAYDDLLKEMKTMNRAQEGAVDSPGKSAIPEFYGAARGDDGSMHMLMEFIDGGDMSEVGDTMNAIGNSGLMPKSALKAMQGDMVGKAATALNELQRQGLLHHDIKGLNIMMTKEGDVRVIDYGESTFVGKDGTAKGDDMGNATPGYAPGDAFKDGAKVNVDNFALGSMLMEMVEQRSVDKWNRNESDSGALGRLINALHKDPNQRVSLEGLAESAFMTSAETDYGEEAMSELRKAATEFTQETRSLKSDKSFDELRDNLKDVKFDDGTELFSGLFKPDKKLGLDDAQDLIKRFDDKIETIMRDLQANPKRLSKEELDKIPVEQRQKEAEEREKKWLLQNREKLAALTKAKAYVQSQVIDEMLDGAIQKATDEYQKAVNDPDNKIDVDVWGQKKKLTLKEAVAVHKDLLVLLQQRRNVVIKWLETAQGEDEDIQKHLDDLNKELLSYDTCAKTLKEQIEKAAGPSAKLHFSKERLDTACVPFGPSEKRRKQEEIEQDLGRELDAMIKNFSLNLELENLARVGAN